MFSVVPSRLARGAGCQPPQASFGAGDEVGGEMTGRRKIGAIKNWYLFNPLDIEYNMMYIAFKVCSIIDSILTWCNRVFYVREIGIRNFRNVVLWVGAVFQNHPTLQSAPQFHSPGWASVRSAAFVQKDLRSGASKRGHGEACWNNEIGRDPSLPI